MLEDILLFLENHSPGIWTGPLLAGIAFVETIFPPFPGDVLFVVVSSWARIGGFSLVWVILTGFTGCLIGTAVLLHVGRSSGSTLKGSYLFRKLNTERINRAEELFRKHGSMILMGSRFIPGIRSLLVVVAGSSGMKYIRAMTAAGMSALVWYGLLSIASMLIGDNIHNVQAFLSLYGKWVWIILGCAVLLYIGLKLAGRGRKKST